MKQKFQSTLSKESSNSFRVNRLTLLDIAANSRSKYGQIAIFKKMCHHQNEPQSSSFTECHIMKTKPLPWQYLNQVGNIPKSHKVGKNTKKLKSVYAKSTII